MTKNRHFFVLLFLFVLAQAKAQHGQALILTPTNLLEDSTYTSDSKGVIHKGELVEILGQSKVIHEDNTQTQRYYWYHIKDKTNAKGWVMGNELALLHLNPSKHIGMNQLTGAPYNIGNGFESSVFYWGEVVGKDNESSHFSAKNEYRENYLVFVNPQNKVVYLPAGTQSERGINTCKGIYFADVTSDGNQEIVLYRSLSGREMDEEVRTIEIYQMVENKFKLIFDRRLNLNFAPMIPSPARFKFVDISPDGIRIEYPKYEKCGNTHFGESIKNLSATYKKCVSWSTETFTWDKISHQFNHFYQPTSLPLRAKVLNKATCLREELNIRSTCIQLLHKKDRLKVLTHVETITKIKGKKVARISFLVKTNNGTIGFLSSDQIAFTKTQHATVLNQFYANPPLRKNDWFGEMDFIRLRNFQKEAHWEVSGNFSPEK